MRGLVARDVADENVSYAADSTYDLSMPNVGVFAGRIYMVRFHSQFSFPNNGAGATDQSWNVLFQVNAVTIDRVARIANQTDAVGTDSSVVGMLDCSVFWEPSVTATTDDITFLLDSVGSNPDIEFQALPSVLRHVSLVDMGL